MKNAVSILVAVLVICCCLFVPAFAADDDTVDIQPETLPESSEENESPEEVPPQAPPDEPIVLQEEPSATEIFTDDDPDPNADVGIPDEITVDSLTVNADNVVLFSLPENNDYPPNSPLAGGLYMQVQTSQLGQVLIYVPIDYQRNSFTYDRSGNIVNIRSSTITGFMYRGNTLYNVYWSALQTPQYRLYSSGTYAALTVTSVQNTNVVFVESNEDIPLVPHSEIYQLVAIVLLGGMLLCLFMKRL